MKNKYLTILFLSLLFFTGCTNVIDERIKENLGKCPTGRCECGIAEDGSIILNPQQFWSNNDYWTKTVKIDGNIYDLEAVKEKIKFLLPIE